MGQPQDLGSRGAGWSIYDDPVLDAWSDRSRSELDTEGIGGGLFCSRLPYERCARNLLPHSDIGGCRDALSGHLQRRQSRE